MSYSSAYERKRAAAPIATAGQQPGVEARLDELKGKGSHAALYYGSRRTTLKDPRKEIGPGLLRAVLRQLGLTPRDLE